VMDGLSAMEYPHWLMMAGAILVAAGFIGLAFHRNKNGPVNVTERLRAMREYASAAGGLKAKGK
jgi:hypothetical protein